MSGRPRPVVLARAGALVLCLLGAGIAWSRAAEEPTAANDRVLELEERVAELESQLRRLQKKGAPDGKAARAPPDGGTAGQASRKSSKKEKPAVPAVEESKPPKDEGKPGETIPDTLLTLRGAELRLSGKAEILFVDSASERNPLLGDTDNPDPHIELERLRLEPRLDIHRGITLRGQIDFKPDDSQTLLKELALEHEALPLAWLESELRIGLQDRFFRPSRPTKNYPLPGNAFWRDETVGLIWRLGFGEIYGKAIANAAQVEPSPPSLLETMGQVRLYFSLGDGPALDTNEVGFDGAAFNDIVQDDRSVTGRLALREVGFGLGYLKESEAFGELELLGFFVNDSLSSDSIEFLRQDLTVRDVITGAPLAGYGDSNSRRSYRYGVGAEYFLPASAVLGASPAIRRNDGLRLAAQWIRGRDGDLRRDGWYAQASYRWSFPRRLLMDRFFRSVEPIVRYGTLTSELEATPLIPATWDRRQVLVGAILEITGNILLQAEYTFNDEHTGGGRGADGVDNDELLLDLIVEF